MGKYKLVLDKRGIAQVLSSGPVSDATYAAAESIAAKANGMCGTYHSSSNGNPYTPHRGANARKAISNVATSSYIGMLDNSLNHTLSKAGGV